MMRRLVSALAAALILVDAVAATDDSLLTPVVISATRMAADPFELPAAVQSVDVRREGVGATLAASLDGVPGLAFRERENRAQEAALSIRGFGARSTFGIRGVRVIQDDVPATQPDGQGQISQFDLATAQRVEVLRGPFSALYGNSSGGVVQLFSAPGSAPAQQRITAAFGPSDERSLQAEVQGATGPDAATLRYHAGASDFSTDGVRGHSAAHRDTLLARVTLEPHAGGRLQLLVSALRTPKAQDPLGLTAAQFAADPWQSAPAALQFNTRKSTQQNQVSVLYETPTTNWGTLRLMAYGGTRGVTQYLAIPAATQADPRHSGGVVDLATHFGGGELRWSRGWKPAGGDLQAVAGLSLDQLAQLRRGYENFVGTTLGISGALRRDEQDTVRDADGYAQLQWTPVARATLVAGVRRSRVAFDSQDRYIRTGNPDDSGNSAYGATSPVASVLWRVAPRWHAYTSAGDGFETPTLAELAYRNDGRAGLNFALQPSRTRQLETGLKFRAESGTHAELALFRARTARELVISSNSGGRSAYANAGRTERAGVELSVGAAWPQHFDWQLAYTHLHATVVDAYVTCVATPCATASTRIAAGNQLAGVAPQQYAAELGWRPSPHWRTTLQVKGMDATPVDDLNSQSARAWNTVGTALNYEGQGSALGWQGFLRLDNLTNQRYAGSVIVNDANGRYYEAAAGRTFSVGATLQFGQ